MKFTLAENSHISEQQTSQLNNLFAQLDNNQINFIADKLNEFNNSSNTASKPTTHSSSKKASIEILYGTESGNCEELAYTTEKEFKNLGYVANIHDIAEISLDTLTKWENAVIIISTWGDGDPPEGAVSFFDELLSDTDIKLQNLNFSVCALGDTSYEQFCKAGKDIDNRLSELGAKRFSPRVDCDIDFEEAYEKWRNQAIIDFEKLLALNINKTPQVNSKVLDKTLPVTKKESGAYNRKNPFSSKLLNKVLLNGTGSDKEIWHLEFSLENSDLDYLPGDALAIMPQNSKDVIDALITAGKFNADCVIENHKGEKISLFNTLQNDYDITNLNKGFLLKYNKVANSDKLTELTNNSEELNKYIYGRQIIDILEDFPAEKLEASDFIQMLRKMQSRLYSIASSVKAHPNEVHLTVAAVRYDTHGKKRKGVASTYQADDLNPKDSALIYMQPNRNFRLPENGDTPIIMIGPGTGIAPFRAFIEERSIAKSQGKNWLIFGDQHFSTDFLYQLEWQDYLKSGVLTKFDTAFSRDQPHKVYVQHRIEENSEKVFKWLEGGAHVYVCGDASRMAKDVHNALINVVKKHGSLDDEKASLYIKSLQKQKRYQRDVY